MPSTPPRPILRAMPRAPTLAILALTLLALPFVLHAAAFGLRGLSADLSGQTRFFTTPLPTVLIFGHMAAGALLTLLAPLQLLPATRRGGARLHRRLGYVILALAAVTGTFGLGYIGLRGTIGGPLMSAGFALYGVLLLVAAANAVYHALDRNLAAHRAWALRLAVLAVGSFLYRLHYWVWYAATGGAGSTPDFTGPFDLANFVGFYLPYLLLLELWLRRSTR
ncbi:DUF2306 domain-containing protein [Roseivivax isoporae]|uniref:DUF2306 domain-containing protein n=1 Tax=Roseivivax isoporae LMG 25204 TaxID=1449351 RepID=X7FDA5_9RHOB|nr:DUF2306 domain-containing protein [Roseivivax isoporae]ETX30041.1 hypothetical protein RISW2_17745 [Roseivivax isoporae LMG 25204]